MAKVLLGETLLGKFLTVSKTKLQNSMESFNHFQNKSGICKYK